MTLTGLPLADFRGPCTNSQGLGSVTLPPEQRTAVCKGPQAEPSQTNRDQEGKEPMGPRPQAASWYSVPELSPQVPTWSVFPPSCTDVPVSLQTQASLESFYHIQPEGGPALPGHVGYALCDPLCLWGSFCLPFGYQSAPPLLSTGQRKRRGENRSPQCCPSARRHPGWQSLEGLLELLEQGTRHSGHPHTHHRVLGGVDLSPDGGGLRDRVRSPAQPLRSLAMPVAWAVSLVKRTRVDNLREAPGPPPPRGAGPNLNQEKEAAKVRPPTLGDAQNFPERGGAVRSDDGSHRGGAGETSLARPAPPQASCNPGPSCEPRAGLSPVWWRHTLTIVSYWSKPPPPKPPPPAPLPKPSPPPDHRVASKRNPKGPFLPQRPSCLLLAKQPRILS